MATKYVFHMGYCRVLLIAKKFELFEEKMTGSDQEQSEFGGLVEQSMLKRELMLGIDDQSDLSVSSALPT